MTDDAFDLELATASLLGDTHDVKMLLKLLVAQLSGALGERLKVEHPGGFLRKSNEIRSVTAQIGDDEFRADISGAALACTVGHTSGGIRIRSEKVDMDEWLRRLLHNLQAEAAHSQAARLALENIVIGGSA